MTNDEILLLAKDIHRGLIFGSWMFGSEDEMKRMISSVFMGTLFLSEEQVKEMDEMEIIHLYEFYQEARIGTVNGYPIFMSFRMLAKKDAGKLFKALERLENLQKATDKSMLEAMDE